MRTKTGLRRRKVTEEAEFVIKEDNALKEKFWKKCQIQKATLSQKEPKELIIPPQQQTILPSEPRLRTNTDASVLM